MMTKIKGNIVWGIVITTVFAVLLAVRLGLFNDSPMPQNANAPALGVRAPETWMNIYQNKKKIGVVHRKFHQLENGSFQTEEIISMHLNTMGVTQALHLTTETDFKPDMSLSSFRFELNSSLFRFTAHGIAGKDSIILFSGLPHAQTKTVLPIKDIPHLSGSIYEAAFRGNMAIDQAREFSILDPSTLSIRKISVTRVADEVIPIMQKRVFTQQYCTDFMGAKHCAWLSKEGEVLRETGLLGLSMEKVSPEKAREGTNTGSVADLAQIASVPSNIKIAEPSKLAWIKFKVGGIEQPGLILQGGRQNFQQNILTITKELVPDSSVQDNDWTVTMQPFLKPSPLVQSDHRKIIAQANQIVSSSDSPHDKIRKITEWVYKNIKKLPVLSVPNALEVLQHRRGDCNEHAVLTAALLRAAGIPAQIETGLVYLNGRFYYHAWNTAYTGEWITVDSVFNQIPADVTHIRLSRGDGSEQLDLLGVMGKITLEVLSTSHD